jgi:hypothetical protein
LAAQSVNKLRWTPWQPGCSSIRRPSVRLRALYFRKRTDFNRSAIAKSFAGWVLAFGILGGKLANYIAGRYSLPEGARVA